MSTKPPHSHKAQAPAAPRSAQSAKFARAARHNMGPSRTAAPRRTPPHPAASRRHKAQRPPHLSRPRPTESARGCGSAARAALFMSHALPCGYRQVLCCPRSACHWRDLRVPLSAPRPCARRPPVLTCLKQPLESLLGSPRPQRSPSRARHVSTRGRRTHCRPSGPPGGALRRAPSGATSGARATLERHHVPRGRRTTCRHTTCGCIRQLLRLWRRRLVGRAGIHDFADHKGEDRLELRWVLPLRRL